jgi:hypothetical protein
MWIGVVGILVFSGLLWIAGRATGGDVDQR